MYQDQLLRLIEERAELERAIGENKTRIEQALLLVGAMVESVPGPVKLDKTSDESGCGTGGWVDPLSMRTFVRTLLHDRGVMKLQDIAEAVQAQYPDTTIPRLRTTMHRLKFEGHIVRTAKATYGPAAPSIRAVG